MLLAILDITLPVLLMLGIGSILYLLKIHFDSKTIGILIIKIATPCLTFSTLVRTEFTLVELSLSGVAAIMVMVLVAAFSLPFIKIKGDRLGAYMSCLLHPNSGNLPLPLCSLAFGEKGLALAFPYFVIVSVSQNTFGYAMIAGNLKWKEFFSSNSHLCNSCFYCKNYRFNGPKHVTQHHFLSRIYSYSASTIASWICASTNISW